MDREDCKPHKSRSRRVGDRGFDRPHVCVIPNCRKAFTRIEHLRRHQLNHQSTQRWTCPACRVAFVRSDLWRRHRRVAHGEGFPEPNAPAQRGSPSLSHGLGNPAHRSRKRRERELVAASTPTGDIDKYQPARRPVSLIDGLAADSLENVPHSRTSLASDFSPDLNSTIATQIGSDEGEEYSPTVTEGQANQNAVLAESGHGLSVIASDTQSRPGVEADWDYGLDLRYPSLTTATDLEWLFDGSLFNSLDDPYLQINYDPPLGHDGSTLSPAAPSIPDHSHPQASHNLSLEIEPQAPTCGFRICNSLTEERRIRLLTCLQNDMPGIDTTSPIFKLNNMKMGVHLFAKEVSKQIPIFHHEVLAPSTEEDQTDVETFYGGEAPYQLSWAIITLGWALWDFHDGRDVQMAMQIQKALRKSLIVHPAFTLDPPIWIIQTLFLVLIFARYNGSREEHGAATIFHGVLIDAVRRLDLRGRSHYFPNLEGESPLRHEWFKWIHVETMKRLVFHTFILDVQHAILHGGDMSMSPFELNLQLPCSEDAWCCHSAEDWAEAMRKKPKEPEVFLTVLKQFWNSSPTNRLPQVWPGESKVILYGIMSIACDMRRRDDNTFSTRPKDSLSSLNAKVLKSFESWVAWWDRNRTPFELEYYQWRNCSCMLQLAYTLYEIGPVDLQAAAGKDVIEGKRIGIAEYARAKRKIRSWARDERALLAVSKAARIIQDRLSPGYIQRSHRYQCSWCLYLAALICWNFSFTIAGASSSGLVQAGQITASSLAINAQSDDYLRALIELPQTGLRSVRDRIEPTTGMLLMLIEVLEMDGSGLIGEGVESLKRLVGLKTGGGIVEEV